MRGRIFAQIALAVLLASTSAAQDSYQWFGFSKAFITAAYPDGIAATELRATAWKAAGSVHSTKCGGNDGELHVGIFDAGLDLPAAEAPPSVPVGSASDWGIVAELPDANQGDGPSALASVATQPVTFTGYLRLWNEGHSTGQVFPSNPHHVLELHPTWNFTAGATTFESRDLIHTMTGYRGYGATKFRPVLAAVTNGAFPRTYATGDTLFVRLRKADNFYQLPVVVTAVHAIAGGHEVTVDVYSDAAFTHRRYTGLRCITVTGSEYDDQWEVGTSDFLLGLTPAESELISAVGSAVLGRTRRDKVR